MDVPSTRCLLSRRSPEIWKVRRGEQTRYKARLNLNSLRLWTTEQTERSVAAQHLSILKHMRDTVAAASAAAPQFWADTDVVHQTCQGVLRAHQTSERELGLSACVVLRATRWLGSTRVTSPAMSLGGALQAHARLVLARASSWEALRAEWIRVLEPGASPHRRGISRRRGSAAAQAVDAARQHNLKHQFLRAALTAERALRRARSGCARLSGD